MSKLISLDPAELRSLVAASVEEALASRAPKAAPVRDDVDQWGVPLSFDKIVTEPVQNIVVSGGRDDRVLITEHDADGRPLGGFKTVQTRFDSAEEYKAATG